MWKPLNLLKADSRPDFEGVDHCYEIAPGDLYPAAVADLEETLKQPIGKIPLSHRSMFIEAQQLLKEDDQAFQLALTPLGEVKTAKRELRAKALNTARRWFTRCLKVELATEITPDGAVVSPQIRLHILNDPNFKE